MTPPSSEPNNSTEQGWEWEKLVIEFISLGYTEALFWSLTPRQINAHLRAVERRLRREHNERMTLAFYVAALPNQKDPVKLSDLLVKVDEELRQDWRDVKARIMAALALASA